MAYLLDSNVFIEAKRRYYGFDFCPAFWDWLVEAGDKKHVFSVEKVRDELIAGGDELSEWVRGLGKTFFLPPDGATIQSLAATVEWARGERYRPGAVNAFAEDPDAYLIAHAHAHGHVVVTHELPSEGVKQVKIPNVCVAFRVKYINAFEMLRRERARFVLGENL
jgi:hypothetical protein